MVLGSNGHVFARPSANVGCITVHERRAYNPLAEPPTASPVVRPIESSAANDSPDHEVVNAWCEEALIERNEFDA